MNLRQRLKHKRAVWRGMAKHNCKLFGLPLKHYVRWFELPDSYKQYYHAFQDAVYVITHYCPGVAMVSPLLSEDEFTPVQESQ